MQLSVHAWTFDLSCPGATTLDEAAAQLAACWRQSLDEGADVVLLPEYAWGGLWLFEPDTAKLSAEIWDRIWPEYAVEIPSDKLVVAGSAPFVHPDGRTTNRALVSGHSGVDKIHLTPFEAQDFHPAQTELPLFSVQGVKTAVLICLDIESAFLSAGVLAQQRPELILVPSATESILGVDRVNRCASARSVEHCAAVVVTHLTGETELDLLDRNQGWSALYLPAQSPLADQDRSQTSALHQHGTRLSRFSIDISAIRAARANPGETNPFFMQ